MKAYQLLLPLLLLGSIVSAQDPTSSWRPNHHESNGMYCYKGAPNPNKPVHHGGGCGCENTLLRLDGKLYMMESAEHACSGIFPGYNSTLEGDCSYFRIRDATTGMVLSNVSNSLRHSFFAAVADHKRRVLWVFGAAHARGNRVNPNKCDKSPYKGCYVGAWSASFDDLTTWSETRQALTLPDGHALFNNDVALVYGDKAPSNIPGLPKHQAVMVLEGRVSGNHSRGSLSPFAVNTGTDGDLGKNWVFLDTTRGFHFDYPKGAAGEGTGDAPTIRFDPDEGYYYSIGGGWITNGPARSSSLKNWTVSPLAPMAVPDTRAAQVHLPANVMDASAGLNKTLYSAIWTDDTPPSVEQWARNLSSWAWGSTDPDLCCGDGKGPSFLINTLSRQGAPSSFHGKTYGFARMRRSPLPLNEWLRSYFPKK